jgi:hypothetical protein
LGSGDWKLGIVNWELVISEAGLVSCISYKFG